MNQVGTWSESVVERKGEPNMVEAWLRRGLAERYAPVLQESLPDEWLELLRRPQA